MIGKHSSSSCVVLSLNDYPDYVPPKNFHPTLDELNSLVKESSELASLLKDHYAVDAIHTYRPFKAVDELLWSCLAMFLRREKLIKTWLELHTDFFLDLTPKGRSFEGNGFVVFNGHEHHRPRATICFFELIFNETVDACVNSIHGVLGDVVWDFYKDRLQYFSKFELHKEKPHWINISRWFPKRIPKPAEPKDFFALAEALRVHSARLSKSLPQINVDKTAANHAPPFEARENITPSPNSKPQPISLVTVMDLAMLINRNDKELAKQTKKRWQNSPLWKNVETRPQPIKKHPRQPQTDLYEPSGLLDFIEKIGDVSKANKSLLLKELTEIGTRHSTQP